MVDRDGGGDVFPTNASSLPWSYVA